MIEFTKTGATPALLRQQALADDSSDVLKEFLSVRVDSAPNENEFIARLGRILPFDAIAITGLNIDGCGLGRGFYLFNNSPRNFARFYTQERFIAVDPIYQTVAADLPLVTWDMCMSAPRDAEYRRQSASLFACLKAYDIAPRTVLTLWGANGPYGAITLSRHRAFTDRELTALTHFGEPMHRLLAAPIIAKLGEPRPLRKLGSASIQPRGA